MDLNRPRPGPNAFGPGGVIKAAPVIKTEDTEMEDAPAAPVATMLAPKTEEEAAELSSSRPDIQAAEMPRLPAEYAKRFTIGVRPIWQKFVGRCLSGPDGQLNPTKQVLTEDDQAFIIGHCKALLAGPRFRPEDFKEMNLRTFLTAILGENPARPTRFPVEAERAARAVYNEFEEQRWGEASPAISSSSNSPPPRTGHSRRGSRTTTAAGPSGNKRRPSQIAQQPTSQSVRPPPNHPIFGNNGIMRGLQIVRNADGRQHFELYISTISSQAFGHNNISVGQWWPRQHCALRDGAHGSKGGGVSMTREGGVRSVVMNSAYEDCDEDNGEGLWYSMPGSVENENPDHLLEKSRRAAEAMRVTHTNAQPIRVLRGAGAGWSGSPTVGLRYDGLYQITDEEVKHNEKGGLYMRFKLERLGGQPKLRSVTRRPTQQEIADEERIKDGYY